MGRSILIIDDEPDYISVVEHHFQESGCDVTTAADGKTGLKLAEKHLPDVILLDIMMPKMDGFEVLQRLKKNTKTASIPVVMLTSRDDDESRLRTAQSYVAGYAVKDMELPALEAKINALMEVVSLTWKPNR